VVELNNRISSIQNLLCMKTGIGLEASLSVYNYYMDGESWCLEGQLSSQSAALPGKIEREESYATLDGEMQPWPFLNRDTHRVST